MTRRGMLEKLADDIEQAKLHFVRTLEDRVVPESISGEYAASIREMLRRLDSAEGILARNEFEGIGEDPDLGRHCGERPEAWVNMKSRGLCPEHRDQLFEMLEKAFNVAIDAFSQEHDMEQVPQLRMVKGIH